MTESIKTTFFFVGLGTLFTHELDAMTHHEWRLLPLLRALPDETGQIVFVALHVPLFAIVVALVASTNARVRRGSRLAIAAFLVIHAALHAWFTRHPDYAFVSLTSQLLIYGGALFGLIYLLLSALGRHV